MKDEKINLTSAILININIMLGAGIFINTSNLAQRAGELSAFMYLIVGALMLPLILSIAQLLKRHPAGGFYTFAEQEISPLAGFFSGWSYFTSKLASCMLMIHVSMTLLQSIFPQLALVPTIVLDLVVIFIFSVLNLLNISAGSNIQKMFICFKIFPIFFVIITGFFLFQSEKYSSIHFQLEPITSSLPLVIYAVIGFEAACSLSGKIKDSAKNAPRAVLISFGVVITIATLYQSIFYGSLGEYLLQCKGHCDIFPAFLQTLMGNSNFSHKLEGVIHLAIASSTLGAAYGIIFSNCWNLHILAKNKHLWGSHIFEKLNRNAIPFACVFSEGVLLLCFACLILYLGVVVPLQQIGALGSVISNTVSVIALFQAIRSNRLQGSSLLLPLLALVSCSLLLMGCIKCFLIDGTIPLMIYGSMILFGCIMYFQTSRREVQNSSFTKI